MLYFTQLTVKLQHNPFIFQLVTTLTSSCEKFFLHHIYTEFFLHYIYTDFYMKCATWKLGERRMIYRPLYVKQLKNHAVCHSTYRWIALLTIFEPIMELTNIYKYLSGQDALSSSTGPGTFTPSLH